MVMVTSPLVPVTTGLRSPVVTIAGAVRMRVAARSGPPVAGRSRGPGAGQEPGGAERGDERAERGQHGGDAGEYAGQRRPEGFLLGRFGFRRHGRGSLAFRSV
jgi:hypothetical protein